MMTNDDELAKKLRIILNHGQEIRYQHDYIGINGRLDALQAAILNVKMRYFEDEVKARHRIGEAYSKALENICITPKIKENRTSVYAQYSIRVPNREKVSKALNERGIPTAVHYPIPLHIQPAFTYLGLKEGDFPVSERVSKEIMSLPMSPYLKEADQNLVIESLRDILC